MCESFVIWCEKICVKYRVDAPLRGKFEAVVDVRHHLDDLEWSMSSGHKLCGWLVHMEVASFKPHLIPHPILGRIFVFDP